MIRVQTTWKKSLIFASSFLLPLLYVYRPPDSTSALNTFSVVLSSIAEIMLTKANAAYTD